MGHGGDSGSHQNSAEAGAFQSVHPAAPHLNSNRNFQTQIRQTYKRKPDRNSLTNTGNQVLIFAYMRSRSHRLVLRCFPELSKAQLDNYFTFAKNIKKSMLNYINISKLTDVWLTPHHENELNYRIHRTVCYHYIREKIVASILTSHKMLRKSKLLHLKARRQLLSLFENRKV